MIDKAKVRIRYELCNTLIRVFLKAMNSSSQHPTRKKKQEHMIKIKMQKTCKNTRVCSTECVPLRNKQTNTELQKPANMKNTTTTTTDQETAYWQKKNEELADAYWQRWERRQHRIQAKKNQANQKQQTKKTC